MSYQSPYLTFKKFIEGLNEIPIDVAILVFAYTPAGEKGDYELVPVVYNGVDFKSTINKGIVHIKSVIAWTIDKKS